MTGERGGDEAEGVETRGEEDVRDMMGGKER